MFRYASSIIIGIGVLTATALPALAHAHLVSAVPAADAVVAAPAALVLHFTEGVEPGFTGVVLTDAGGRAVATRPTAAKPGDATTITVPVTATLPAGRYAVSWHALAVDGHKTSGSYGFVVAPPATTP